MQLKLVTAAKPTPATGLTMGGPPPRRPVGTQPGLTFAQGFGTPQSTAEAPSQLRLVARDGVRLEQA